MTEPSVSTTDGTRDASEGEELLRHLLDSANVATWEWDIALDRVTGSSNIGRVFGLGDAEVSLRSLADWMAIVHPADQAKVREAMAATVDGGVPLRYEFRSLRPDGTLGWTSVHGYAVRDDSGRTARLRGVIMDVSALRDAQDALVLPAHVLTHMSEAVTVADARGILLYTNPAADRMFGYAPGELIGQPVRMLNGYSPEEGKRRTSAVMEQLRAVGEWQGEWEDRTKDGKHFTTRLRITTVELKGEPCWMGVQVDITEELSARRKADALAESLRASERQMRLVTDALPALVTYMGPERRFRFTNKAYKTWLGVDPQSLIGKHARELMGDAGYRVIAPYMDRALAGEQVQYEHELPLADGRKIYAQMNYVPDKDEEGRTLGYVALIHDMTDRHRAELALQSERQRLHDILMNAPAGIALRSGPEGIFTYVNAKYQQVMGNRNVLGMSTREALPEKTTGPIMELLQRVYETGEVVTANELPTRFEGGVERLWNVTLQPLRDAEGRVDSVVSFAVEVTEEVAVRTQAERLTAALRESEARYRSFVNQSTEGICRVELDAPISIEAAVDAQVAACIGGARIAECNDAMSRMYGYVIGDELVDRPLAELLVPEGPLSPACLGTFFTEDCRLEGIETQGTDGDGRSCSYRSSLVGVVEDGWLRRIWLTQRDVSTEVEARQQAEAGNRAKDEFLALLGHELRNPLSPILSALELMKVGGADVFRDERAVIERQVAHVVRLVDDLLDVSRITRGLITLERRKVDLADVISSAVELASPLFEQREHRLLIEVPGGLTVDGDPTRLSQVFSNLLTNAAKYTPRRGRITIGAERMIGRARVFVRDNGIGIRPGMLPVLFDRFVQERQALDRSEGGLGLGLAIVRSLVEMHGGTVEARSEGLGRGSEFSVTLPLSVATGDTGSWRSYPLPGEVRIPGNRRVLVVDDSEDTARLTAKLLRAWGLSVRVANNGPDALRIAESFIPDVALLDIGLPDMDGYELAGRFRSTSEFANLKLVAVTGYGQESDREAAGRAGFHEHLVKPVDLALLERVLRRMTGSGEDR